MTTCGDIRARALRSEPLGGAGVEAHLAACPACAELARAPAPLAGALASLRTDRAAPAPAELEHLLGGLHARLDAEASPLRRAKSLSTPGRIAAVLALGSPILGTLGWVAPRPDLGELWRRPPALVMVATALLALAVLRLALRPTHRPALSRARVVASFAAGLAALAALASYSAISAPPGPGAPPGMSAGAAIFWCFRLGLLLALPVYALVRLLDRGATRLGALLTASYAGVFANLALDLHCPTAQLVHLLLGHVGVAALLGAAAYALAGRGRSG